MLGVLSYWDGMLTGSLTDRLSLCPLSGAQTHSLCSIWRQDCRVEKGSEELKSNDQTGHLYSKCYSLVNFLKMDFQCIKKHTPIKHYDGSFMLVLVTGLISKFSHTHICLPSGQENIVIEHLVKCLHF